MRKQDERGNMAVGIPLSFQIPTFTLEREISGTIYTINGSYDGKATLLAKVVHLMQ